jgi:hypothetical protein
MEENQAAMPGLNPKSAVKIYAIEEAGEKR